MADITLRIELVDLMLHVNNAGGKAIMLLPEGQRNDFKHVAKLSGRGIPDEKPFNDLIGCEIRFLHGKKEVFGRPTKPSAIDLLDLAEIDPSAKVLPKFLVDDGKCPSGLNARLWFPPAETLKVEKPAKKEAEGQRWRIGQGQLRSLSDRLTFISKPAANWTIVVRPNGGTEKQIELKPATDSDVITLTLENKDHRKCDALVNGKKYKLTDYKFLYQLTDLKDPPVPEGIFGKKPDSGPILDSRDSDCLPICGEAQCG